MRGPLTARDAFADLRMLAWEDGSAWTARSPLLTPELGPPTAEPVSAQRVCGSRLDSRVEWMLWKPAMHSSARSGAEL